MPEKDNKEKNQKPTAEAYGEKVGKGYLVGGQTKVPLGGKVNLSAGYNKVIGENFGGNSSLSVSKQTKKGGEVSLGYSSGKNYSAEYTTPKGNRFSASYNPDRGALISAKINLGKKKK